jgi:hypothetical protein
MTVRRETTAGAFAAALLAVACRTAGGPGSPAVITDPTAEGRAVLARAVSAALGGVPVTLADDALTRTSTLIVERARLRDESGLPVAGRELGAPERFRLVRRGDGCFLVHERTGREVRLEGTSCAATGG